MSLPTIIFDDGDAAGARLAPLTDLRAAFDLRTGALTTLERFSAHLHIVALSVPDSLRDLVAQRHPLPVNKFDRVTGPDVLLINGRAPLAAPAAAAMKPGQIWRDSGTSALIAAVVPAADIGKALGNHWSAPSNFTPPESPSPHGFLLSRPWHIRTLRDACLRTDLDAAIQRLLAKKTEQAKLPESTLRAGDDRVFIDASATVFPGVCLDTTSGPIWIDAHATIRPGAILCGPAYIGPNSTVLDRALIKSNTAIGPHCKVAGEVGGTIFQGFANKAHDGHLGDSFVGEWANLGAGTTNSNLLNTYTQVIARALEPDGSPGPNERTGEQFLGAIIGDHAKFAICTRIMTGAIIGTGTMWAATAPVSGTVAPFSWVTDAGERRYALAKFTEVLHAVLSRRKLTPSPALQERLAALHAQSRREPA